MGKMVAVVCELCGGNELVKEGGFFVCQHCGTKYTLEEAKKLIDGSVVQIDHSNEVNEFLKSAEHAIFECGDIRTALSQVEKVLSLDPNNYRGLFIKALATDFVQENDVDDSYFDKQVNTSRSIAWAVGEKHGAHTAEYYKEFSRIFDDAKTFSSMTEQAFRDSMRPDRLLTSQNKKSWYAQALGLAAHRDLNLVGASLDELDGDVSPTPEYLKSAKSLLEFVRSWHDESMYTGILFKALTGPIDDLCARLDEFGCAPVQS